MTQHDIMIFRKLRMLGHTDIPTEEVDSTTAYSQVVVCGAEWKIVNAVMSELAEYSCLILTGLLSLGEARCLWQPAQIAHHIFQYWETIRKKLLVSNGVVLVSDSGVCS